jgi:hypothetical protein
MVDQPRRPSARRQGTAAGLRVAGLDARVEAVPTRRLADAGGSILGFRVRVGTTATREAEAIRARLIATGLAGSAAEPARVDGEHLYPPRAGGHRGRFSRSFWRDLIAAVQVRLEAVSEAFSPE